MCTHTFAAYLTPTSGGSPSWWVLGSSSSGSSFRTDGHSTAEPLTAGTVSSLHHDTYHNVFVQVAGAKRWWLLPPTAWQHAYSFPKGHERARQSPRVPVFEWHRRARRAAGAREVVTRPGEVLHVPPYWLQG